MKRFFLHIAFATLALALGGCISEDIVDTGFCRDYEVTLNLSLNNLTRTGTPNNGVGEGTNDDGVYGIDGISLNENLIKSLDIFMYPSNATTDDAVFATRYIPTNDEGVADKETVELKLNASAMTALFGSATTGTCKVYVVANYDTGKTTATTDGTYPGTKVSDLKHIVVSQPDFATTTVIENESVEEKTVVKPQESFVMDSEPTDVNLENKRVSGTVYLTRAASKITFRAFVAKSITITGEDGSSVVWYPDLQGATLALHNLAQKSYIDNDSDEGATGFVPADTEGDASLNSRVTVSGIQMTEGDVGTVTPGFVGTVEGVSAWNELTIDVPFYSYGTEWSAGAKNETYINLSVPWHTLGTNGKETDPTTWTSIATYNYFVPINLTDSEDAEGNVVTTGKLVRNKHYKIGLRVGVLGDLDPLAESEYSYEVLDWVGQDVHATLTKPKYLVVEKDEVYLYNQNQVYIPYKSSDPVTITLNKIEYESYRYATTRTVTISSSGTTILPALGNGQNINVQDAFADYSAVNVPDKDKDGNNMTNGNINFNHTIKPNTFSIQKIYLTVQHTNDANYKQEVVIYQYPPIYFKGQKSNGVVFVNNYAYSGNSSYRSVTDDDGNGIGSVSDPDGVDGADTGNVNQNNYKVYVTVGTYENYLVGDPRVSQGDELSGIDELTNYRPTNSAAANIIAPAFMIASSYGKTTTVSYTRAQERCAAYQENGYPAGRWRIPTPAEIQFVVNRSSSGDIAQLFDGQYWAGNSTMYSSSSNSFSTGTSTYVRCVYDLWYWGDDPVQSAMNTAKWGDAKTNDQL